ncbi:hypothetical protein XA68_13264 [Ophiocordyceps unilateralis]|uniref:SET domain-containing protein n=1 Tax=Ophiocordyceps unilateralis TaxID=268505 RepID=A0A2A9PM01_OPHUN|nr:hypothetical protein XA68_13264 [Ophiocordyceps unilateralis]
MEASSDFGHQTQVFSCWFKALSGAVLSDAVEIADLRSRDAGRGVVATRDISADTVLFRIPRKAIISIETSDLRQRLPQLFHSHGDDDEQQELDAWSALILVLMYEHFLGSDSSWKPYLDVLPETFDTPMFWSDQELAELQASALPSKIGKAEADDTFRTRLLPVIRGRPDVFRSSEGYSDQQLLGLAHRMGSTVMAYAFDLENDEDDDEANEDGWVENREDKALMGMVPMADMMNADAEFNAHVNHEDEHLTVTSLRPIQAGEEILNYYGPHPNSELLRRYGYVTDKHARYDIVELPWSRIEDATAAHLNLPQDVIDKSRIRMQEDDELEDSFVLERVSNEPLSDGTLDGTASVSEVPADLHRQLKALLKILQGRDVLDKRARDEVQTVILTRALVAVESSYRTSMAEDELLLRQDGGLSKRRKMAIQVRLGEKRLINEVKIFLAADEPASRRHAKKVKSAA